jgi:large subunit ribosomal protein L24
MRDLKYRETKRAKSKNARRHAMNAERVKMPVVKGDTVRVMRGNDKGKEGKIIRVHTKTGRIVVEGVAMVKKHRKARTADEQSGIIDFPAAIHHSNVMLLDPSTGEPTRVRARLDDDGTKERVSAKSGEPIPKIVIDRRGK